MTQFCHAGWADKTNDGGIRTGKCKTVSLGNNQPRHFFFCHPPLPSTPPFLTSNLLERTGVPPLDQGDLASELISVGPSLSANSRLFIILAAWLFWQRVHILCSITGKPDSIASPACPGAVPLPCRHRNHHNCSANHVPVPTWTSP